MSPKNRSKASSREPLNRERIVGAAVALADESGVAALTMNALGARLGVRGMSLYHHVGGKEQILDGMVDVVFGEIDLPEPGEPWRAAMQRRAISARAALTRHRWAIGMMESRRTPGLATLRHHDAVLGSLRAGGFSMAMAAHAYALLDSYIYGFVLQELNLPFETSEELADTADGIVAVMPEGVYPHLVEMIGHAMAPGYAFGNEFPFGLEVILEGLARRVDG